MRRWNGWGDDSVTYLLPAQAADFLTHLIGPGTLPYEATWEQVVAGVPASRLPHHPLVSQHPADRVRHARGQSFPDWVVLRFGRIPAFPDGVAFPMNEAEVEELLRFAKTCGAKVIPYGGGTSVVGHINPQTSTQPVLTVSLERLNGLLDLDETSQLATFAAGISGPNLEAQLRAHGYTLGHFPQSFEYSTLGGWVVTRSSGQQSLKYGRIENLFAGGRMITPQGVLEMLPSPASAAGPDIRQLVLGSEGRMGILTQAQIRVTPLPETEEFHAVFFPDFAQGQTAVRAIVQAGLPLSMMRLSTAVETTTTLALAGHEFLIGVMEKLLAIRGVDEEKCMLLLGFTGRETMVKTTRKEALGIASEHRGMHIGKTFGKQWHKGRFRTPYLRNTLWQMGYGVDTLETAVPWSSVTPLLNSIETSLRPALAHLGERVHVFTHLSHVYSHGASIYTTYAFRLAPDPDETLARWQTLKTAASQIILAHGGTISHQHGVGTDHTPYLPAEKGALGMAALTAVLKQFDPDGMMNPGKLLAE